MKRKVLKIPPHSKRRAIKALSASVRLILTGTPIENQMTDLWSLFDFASPGLLGAYRAFANYAKKPDFHATVRRLVSPYILRRLKSDKKVIADLPDKTEIAAYCALSKSQIAAYQQTVKEPNPSSLIKKISMALRGAVWYYHLYCV